MLLLVVFILSNFFLNFALISNNIYIRDSCITNYRVLYCSSILRYNVLDSNDRNVLAIKENKLLLIKKMSSKEILNELKHNGIHTKSIMDRFELEKLLTNIYTVQEISKQTNQKNLKRDKGKEAYYLNLQLQKLRSMEFEIIYNEILKRNLSCNPLTEDRENLMVILAKDIVATNIDISHNAGNTSMFMEAFSIGNMLFNATIKQGNDIINDLNALTTTSAEKDAIQFIQYGHNKSESFQPSNDNDCLYDVSNSKAQQFEEVIQYLFNLSVFDEIVIWAKSKNRAFLIELLEYLNIVDVHQDATISSLAAQLADTIMVEKSLVTPIQDQLDNANKYQSDVNNDKYFRTDKSTPLRKKLDNKKKSIDSFTIEKDLYDSFNKRLGIVLANSIVKLENLLFNGFGKLFNSLQHSSDLFNTGFFRSFVTGFKSFLLLISTFIIQIADWSGSRILSKSQTITLACGYTILYKKGILGLATTFVLIRLFLTAFFVNNSDVAADSAPIDKNVSISIQNIENE